MKLVTRAQAGLRPPKQVNKGNLNKPSTGHWNGPTVTVGGNAVFSHDKCAAIWRGIQSFHMNTRGWNDIAYNFGICQHGYVFEGRGLNVRNGANGTNEGNKTSHCLMMMAGPGNPFNTAEKAAFRDCVKYVADHTDAPYSALGHRDWHSTECPGGARYDWIHGGMKLALPPGQPKPYNLGDKGANVDFARGMLNIVQKYRKGKRIKMTGPVDGEFIAAVKEFQYFCEGFIQYTSKGKKHFGNGPPFTGIMGSVTQAALANWVKEALK
jgi:hypothetical protein